MNTTSLAPLILPPPITSWPPAWGWWVLGLVLALMITSSYQRVKYRLALRKEPLEKERVDAQQSLKLSTLQQLTALAPATHQLTTSQWLQQINQLLKRLAVTRYGDLHPQTLTGRDWLAFLDSRCPSAGLTRWMILVEGPYKPDCQLPLAAQVELYKSVTLWVDKHV